MNLNKQLVKARQDLFNILNLIVLLGSLINHNNKLKWRQQSITPTLVRYFNILNIDILKYQEPFLSFGLTTDQ